ncbi:MAG: SNF2-related protein [Bacteroidia bacterium]
MAIFFPDQRWTSEGEPELGVGIVSSISKGRVEIYFPASGAKRLYSEENAPLRRVIFKPGDTIVDIHKRALIVEKVKHEGNLILYIGQDRTLPESELGDVSVSRGVADRLSTGEVDSPQLFALRRKTLEYDHYRRISPVSGFVGGRIDLIPHQLYIAHEVSTRYAPRVLLSDEVGLGKTIEACLILHRLLQSGRISRVLILVPESLVHQWFVEIFRRFNLWFHIFDEERCVAIEEGAPEGNPFLASQLVICSTSFPAGSELRTRQALAAGWDMLVVDEAHHLEWAEDKVSPGYEVVDRLSSVARGLLLLTATPEQLGLESHFARLRLLDPERYNDFATFTAETLNHKKIADTAERLASGEKLSPADTQLLESLLGKKKPETTTPEGKIDRQRLIDELLDQHGPGRVIFRNTRAAMKGFPRRKAHLIPLNANEDEDAVTEWLINLMEDIQPEKVLLICKSREKVLALEETLRRRASVKVGVFHEELTIVQRDRNAAWFSEPDGARLLLCSEIGSEGRNFQFAHHLVLFDMPAHPELLEQRIGRLDRIGQSEDITIHIPYETGSREEILVRWYHEGLNAFEKNLEGGNQIMQMFGERLEKLSPTSPDAETQLAMLIGDTTRFHQNLLKTLAEGRDRLLEMNSFRPEIAEKLVSQIRAADMNMDLENYMNHIFEHFGVETEDLAPRTYLLHPPQTENEVFPSIPEEGISITFDRKRAISREEVSFLSWDHPMVTGVIDMILSSGTGNAAYGILRTKGAPGILLEALFVLETRGGHNLHVDRFLPGKPLRVVVDHTGREVTELYPAETFDQQVIPGNMDELLDNESFMEILLPNMITSATEIAETLAETEIARGLERMNTTLSREISRLHSLQKKNKSIRPEEIQMATQEQQTLNSLIRDAKIRPEALQIIRRG